MKLLHKDVKGVAGRDKTHWNKNDMKWSDGNCRLEIIISEFIDSIFIIITFCKPLCNNGKICTKHGISLSYQESAGIGVQGSATLQRIR